MIGGSIKILRAPFFNMENPAFSGYPGYNLSSFSLDANDYFLHREEGLTFDLESYYDVILAPLYVINQKKNNYPTLLIKLFFKLFPTPKEYKESLEKALLYIYQYLDFYKVNSSQKANIESSISIVEERHKEVKEKIASSINKFSNNHFLLVSDEYLGKIEAVISNFKNAIRTTPCSIIKYNYYIHNPNVSSIDHPFSFFHNILFEDGLEKIATEWAYERAIQSSNVSFEDYFIKEYHQEIRKTFRLIVKKINDYNKQPHLKRKYFKEICEYVNIFYVQSKKHEVIRTYPDNYIVFQWLSLVENPLKLLPLGQMKLTPLCHFKLTPLFRLKLTP